jgi:hypothetical protein
MPTPNVASVGATPAETVATWAWRPPADTAAAVALPPGITFGDEGRAVMARELGAVAAELDDGLFDGVAVHHLDLWPAMRD